MKKIWIAIIIIAVVALAIVLIMTQTKREPSEIKIGAILPLTGETAQVGEWAMNGLKLAEEYVNSFPKTREKSIRLIFEDGMGDAKVSLSAFKKLVEVDKVKIVFSIISSVDLTLIPEVKKQRIFFFSHAAHPKISGIDPLVYRHSQTAYQEAKLISSSTPIAVKDIAIAYMNDDYSIALKDELLKEFEIQNKNVNLIMFEKGEIDFLTVATKILEKKPEFTIIVGYGKNSGLLIVRLKEMGYRGKILVNLGFIISGATQSAGENIKGVSGVYFDIDITQKGYSEINQLYKNKHNAEIPVPALQIFNSLYLLNYAIENVGSDPFAIAEFLKTRKTFQGLGETITITENNDILPSLKIVEF